ncbi:MAG: hypothetical protein MUF85_02940 [Patescibacteria group bacterium]|nr:hypothetical protein [Patescibacteria group bacterium]
MMFKIGKKSKKENSKNGRVVNQQQGRVVSYYAASRNQIDKYQRASGDSKSTANPLRVRVVLVFAVIMTGLLLYAVIALPSSPRVIVKDSEPYRSASQYNEIVDDIVSSSWKNKIKMTFQKDEIEQAIKDVLPEADTVKVRVPLLGQRPAIIIQTASPLAIVNQTGGASFVITNGGRVAVDITKTPLMTDKLSSLQNNSGVQFKEGDQIFKPTEVEAVKELLFQYKSKGQEQVAMIIPENLRELHIQNDNYIVKYSLDIGPTTSIQFGAMKAVQQAISQGRQAPPAQYIDVRLGDKVFIL